MTTSSETGMTPDESLPRTCGRDVHQSKVRGTWEETWSEVHNTCYYVLGNV